MSMEAKSLEINKHLKSEHEKSRRAYKNRLEDIDMAKMPVTRRPVIEPYVQNQSLERHEK